MSSSSPPLAGHERPALSEAQQSNIRKAVVASTVGTLIEWYDYALYFSASGLIINKLFFPQFSAVGGILASFATFAVGFFVRPLGGIVISHFGDKFGRKPALVFTIALMGGATVGIGLLPTYDQIGVLAPVLLVLLRMMQGFGAGAELAGAMTLVAEYTPANRRAYYTAIPNAATVGGVLMATLSFLAISQLPESALMSWAWRVPFMISAVLFFVALYIRNRLDETPEYVAAMARADTRRKRESVPIAELLRTSKKQILFGFLSVSGHNANAYIIAAFSVSYMTNTLHMSRTDSLTALSIAAVCGIIGAPVMGALADRIGSGKVFMAGAIFAMLMAFPLFWLLDTRNLIWATLGMCLGYGFGFGCTAGGQGAFLANLFPTRYRFSGIALTRELNGVAVAGPTPFIASALVALADGRPTYVSIYVMACCALTVISVLAVQRLAVFHSAEAEEAIENSAALARPATTA
ncbi:MHS family MFS transporter [Rhodovastum atsumiense]|uniref:MFS transporter n=1 Tax=Rhodovastum atsumiense TaxID=504468 RepID=UPI002025A93D|nr:MFS transporter [Rhodovastum atsumiense]CAH2598724.1 MHS family MFS transporter [Rhodovastum atsumiense]